MRLLLDLLYVCLLLVCLPWLIWSAWRKGKYRAGWSAKFLGHVPRPRTDKPCIWLHAVSVGEVNLLAPVLEGLAERHPDHELVVSSTTRTGYALAQQKYADLQVFYCPLDFSWAVRAALRRLRPRMLVLAELELWPNLIAIASAEGVRIAVINGRLSHQSWRGYRRLRPCFVPMLQRLDLIAVQSEEYAERFLSLGAIPNRLCVTGNVKFDGLQTDRRQVKTSRLRDQSGLRDNDVVFLAGSTQEPEEEVAVATFRELASQYPALRLIVCPRHPERFEAVAHLLAASGLPFQRRTAFQHGSGSNNSVADERWRILLVDSVGELADWWGTADIAFVGGSLTNRGGQNMVEPAAYGAAVTFGPNTWNFRDIVAMLLAHDAARVVHDGQELTQFVAAALATPAEAAVMGQNAQRIVVAQQGATTRTLELLGKLLSGPAQTAADERAAA